MKSVKDLNRKEFIEFIAPFAVDSYKKYNIWPSITIAQAIEESGWGKRGIGYNLFGIKSTKSWKDGGGKSEWVMTTEMVNGKRTPMQQEFRLYDSFQHAMDDHSRIVGTLPRYERVRRASNYKEAANMLFQCGYAGNPSYATNLINIINSNKLYDYDKKVSNDPNYRPEDAPSPSVNAHTSNSGRETAYGYIADKYEESDLVNTERILFPDYDDFYLSEVDMASGGVKSEHPGSKSPNQIHMPTILTTPSVSSDGGTGISSGVSYLDFCIDDHIDFNDLGYNDVDAFFLLKAKAVVDAESIKMNYIDGDTVKFDIGSVVGGDKPFKIGSNKYASFKEYVRVNASPGSYQANDLDFSIRVLGIDAPELPHYSNINLKNYNPKDYEIRKFKYKDVKSGSRFIYENKVYSPEEEITFIRFKDSSLSDSKTWNQYSIEDDIAVSKDESDPSTIDDGYTAQKIVIDMINSANDVFVMLDAVSISSDALKYRNKYKARGQSEYSVAYDSFLDFMTGNNAFKFLGFNSFGQDLYKRYLGAIYVNIDTKKLPLAWQKDAKSDTVTVNLAKYLIANVDLEVLPSFNAQPVKIINNNFVSDAFRLYSYNLDKRTEEVMDKISSQLDDRDKIQSDIFNMNMDKLKDWTVTIGDTTLFIPPTSIRSISESASERSSLLRAKGAITKESPKSKKSLELMLYFNDEDGINGYPYEETLPNGETITYYMNGLRALISQFKFTPFLPIENHYINDVLGIEAVTLSNLQMTTMPNYPRCITATLMLEDFNYRVYMPELSVDTDPDVFADTNYFAKSINFPTMRWYYQQPLINGARVLDHDLTNLDIYPEDLIKETFGNRTMLAPMTHQSSEVLFYVPDEELLKKKLQIKMEAMKKSVTNTFKHSDSSKAFIRAADSVYQGINSALPGPANQNITLDSFNNNDQEALVKKLKAVPYINDVRINKMINASKGFVLTITIEQVIDKQELSRLKESIFGDEKESASKFYKNEEITLELRANGGKFTLDKSQLDYLFLVKLSQLVLESGEIHDIQGSFEDMKNSIDIEDYDSMRFIKYDIDDINIANISCSYQNVLSEIGLNGIDGYAPQYMGGQDTVIDVMFQTSNESVVAKLYALPELVAEHVRLYRQVMTSWPLRISSDITNLLGIYEAVVENVQAETVPNQPGVFNVQMRLISVDRTLRNREALIKLDNINNEGYQGLGTIPYKDLNTYFDFKKAIGQVEVYPDLELPTISDIEKTGLLYVRNKNQPDQKYVDPDFYFVYSHAIFSEMVRDGIVEYFKGYDKASKSQHLSDSYGGSATITFDDDVNIFSLDESNNIYGQQVDQMNDFTESNDVSFVDMEHKDVEVEAVQTLDGVAISEDWSIAKEVKVVLLEDKYLDSINSKEKNPIKTDYEKKRLAAETVMSYLKSNPVTGKDPTFEEMEMYRGNRGASWDARKSDVLVQSAIKALEKDVGIKLKDLGLELFALSSMVRSAKAAASSEREYSKDNVEASFARSFYDTGKTVPIGSVSGGSQDLAGVRRPVSIRDMVDNGLTAGPFGIRFHTAREITLLTGSAPSNKNKKKYLLDPYYTNINDGDIELYSYSLLCTVNHMVSITAFVRLCLYWQAKMIIDKIVPSVNVDLQREAIDAAGTLSGGEPAPVEDDGTPKQQGVSDYMDAHHGVEKKPKENSPPKQKSINEYMDIYHGVDPNPHKNSKEHKKFLKDVSKEAKENDTYYERGSNFLPVLMALTNGNPEIYGMLKNKNYAQLNQYKEAVISGENDLVDDTTALSLSNDVLFRRYVLGLIRLSIVKDIENVSVNKANIGDMTSKHLQEKLYISAADDPSKYILHSFVDMISNDKRGRMLRAFPTFYMCFIDEGYKTGVWKLTDNFYNYNAISEIQVVRSRKIAADTAKITMSNSFNSLTSEDEDIKENYHYNFRDVLQSYTNPKKDYEKRRALKEEFSSVEKAKIQPGTRIHVRMGYGSNAASLPVAFNGSIAEIGNGPYVTIIAQGDGIELTNPIMSQKDAEEIENDDSFAGWIPNLFIQSNTPKAIMSSILTYKGGFMNKKVVEWTDGRFGNQSPFGIAHFGNPNNTEIFLNSEISQNIYEGSASSPWNTNDSVASIYSSSDAPKLTFGLFGKTVWDIMHICSSASPDYLTGVVPFGLRSSIFQGLPHYYYAYDYIEKDSILHEKRKPYQQFHLYTSYSDIVNNGISVTGMDMKTAAIGTYVSGGSDSGNQKTVGPLWADFMIYPEKQKTMVYDTSLVYKGIGGIGKFLWVNNVIDYFSDDTGLMQSGYKVAWRMTADALKESIKDMYQGELVVLGDPSVKPNDRVYISDTYENMTGPCLAETVVQTMSAEMGYLTSITPDAISVIDDRRELELQNMAGKALSIPVSGFYTTVAITSMACGYRQPFLKLATKGTKAAAAKLTEDGIYKFGKEAAKGVGKYITQFKTGAGAASAVSSAKAGAASLFSVGSATAMALELGVVFIATQYVAEAIERKMMNYRILQVFPLKKNGMPYTAGLNGSKGLVFGSPSYEDSGYIGEIFDKVFIKHADDPFVAKALKTIFTTESMQRIAESYQRNNNMISEDGSAIHEIAMSGIGELLSNTELNSQVAIDSMSKHKNANIPSQDLAGHVVVYDSKSLTQLKSKGRFTTLHEMGSQGIDVMIKEYTINNEQKKIPIITYDDKDVYNLQLVSKRLMPALESLVSNSLNKNKKAEAILTSGLQLSSSKGMSSDSCIVFISNISRSDIEDTLKDIERKYQVLCTEYKDNEMEGNGICILLRTKSTTTSSTPQLTLN